MRFIDLEFDDEHRILFFGDTHFGSRGYSQGAMDAIIRRARSPAIKSVIHLGDVAEAVAVTDKRWAVDEHGHSTNMLQQYVDASEQFERFRGKLDIILCGNHDVALAKKHGDHVRSLLCNPKFGLTRVDGSEVIYGTYQSRLTVNVGDLEYRVFLWHGRGAAPRGDPLNPMSARQAIARSLVRNLNRPKHSRDVMASIQGHFHQLHAIPPTKPMEVYDDREKLITRRRDESFVDITEFQGTRSIPFWERFYGMSGTTKKSIHDEDNTNEDASSSWEEEQGMDVADLGWLELVYSKGKLRLEPHYYDGGK